MKRIKTFIRTIYLKLFVSKRQLAIKTLDLQLELLTNTNNDMRKCSYEILRICKKYIDKSRRSKIPCVGISEEEIGYTSSLPGLYIEQIPSIKKLIELQQDIRYKELESQQLSLGKMVIKRNEYRSLREALESVKLLHSYIDQSINMIIPLCEVWEKEILS